MNENERRQAAVQGAMKAIQEEQSARVEALCTALVREKGPSSVLDFELRQEPIEGGGLRFQFRRHRPPVDQAYVLGFAFQHNSVYLIAKERPEWQAGKLNGIGGKVEPGESTSEAMRREFREEAGVDVESWKPFCELRGTGWMVDCFTTELAPDVIVHSMTDEQVVVARADDLPDAVLPNLRWLVPMARDLGRTGLQAEVDYHVHPPGP